MNASALVFQNNLEKIQDARLLQTLGQLQRGIEKESLRIDTAARLAKTPHPATLGSALTHNQITTDYSEALLEFITPVHRSIPGLIDDVIDLHTFTYQNIGSEKIWPSSMPCITTGEDDIPIAHYGTSNVGQMREIYRRGLAWRYGKLMQIIAGVHYNFSLPDSFWRLYLEHADDDYTTQKSAHYFSMVRNFKRYCWLIPYLFGAAPAADTSFFEGKQHHLKRLSSSTIYGPYATSLRLGDHGYQNNTQSKLDINYDDLSSFIRTLKAAIQTPHAPYEEIGVKVDGEYRQLNANILQIENEFYAAIRPKQIALSGESPTHALSERGVEYVEIRCLDLNPFFATGIDPDSLYFIDILLIYCLLQESPIFDNDSQTQHQDNMAAAVNFGRNPDTKIYNNSKALGIADYATHLIDEPFQHIAELLDQAHKTTLYSQALKTLKDKIHSVDQLPAAKVMAAIKTHDNSFITFSMQQAQYFQEQFEKHPLSRLKSAHMRAAATASLKKQSSLEREQTESLDHYLTDYWARNA